jgi:hypothetical protein
MAKEFWRELTRYSPFRPQNEWTVILNRDTTLYGTGGYDQYKDALRFTSKPEKASRFYESFTIDIDVVPNDAVIYLSWEKTQISFKIETESAKLTNDFIEQTLLADKSTNSDDYAVASEYYFYLNKEFDRVLILIDKAIGRKKELWYFRLKVDILEKEKKFSEAINTVNQAIEVIRNKPDWDELTKRQSIKENEVRIKKLRSAK